MDFVIALAKAFHNLSTSLSLSLSLAGSQRSAIKDKVAERRPSRAVLKRATGQTASQDRR